VGFAVGMERLVDLMPPDVGTAPELFACFLGGNARSFGVSLVKTLRQAGVSVRPDYEDRSLKSYLKTADKEKTRWCLIAGDEELNNNQVLLKDMAEGRQEVIAAAGLIARLKELGLC